MPAAIVAERPDAAQHAVGILPGRDVAEGEGVGREQGGQRGVPGVGQNHVAAAAHFPRKIIVVFDKGSVRHLHRRMVGTQFVEEDVERDGFRALIGQFRDEPAIDFARPVEAEMKADAAVFHGGDAGFLDGDEGEVGGGGRGKMQRGPRAQVISHPFQPLEKIQPRQPQAADERKDGEGQKNRRAFDGLEFHHAGLNKKPEQLKAALVF